jgi:GntR family transcriptional regulator
MDALSLKIDKNSPIPIYFQIRQGIEKLIDSGDLKPGEYLPSETALSRAYEISAMTVRQAMAELVNAGYVRRERGRGTIVLQRRMQHSLENLISFSEDMQSRNILPGSRLLIFEQSFVPPVVMARVGLSPDSILTRIRRVRLADDVPVGIHDSFVYGIMFTRADLERTGSLYQLFEQHDIHLSEGEETIEAIAAASEDAALLRVPVGFPLLKTSRFSWATTGQFVEYVVALYHADLYRYTLRLRR